MGGATLIYLAALQNIPGELYEAAELDGAGICRADLARDHPADPADPSLMLMLQIVATMQVFIEPYPAHRRRPGGRHDHRRLPHVPVRVQLQRPRRRGARSA